TWDVGADFTLLGQRLAGSIDWYNKHTVDLLFNEPAAAGQFLSNYVTRNIGSVKHTGVPRGLTARLRDPSPTGGLSWTTSLNVSHNTNELLTINPNAVGVTGSQILTGGIAGGVGSTVQVLEPGEPVISFFVCHQVYSGGKPVEGRLRLGRARVGCANGPHRAERQQRGAGAAAARVRGRGERVQRQGVWRCGPGRCRELVRALAGVWCRQQH